MIKELARALTPRWMWSRLRAWKMRRVLESFKPFVVEHSYGGIRLKVQISDPLGQGWYDHDWPSLPEIDPLRQGRLKAGARVFDIGAHQGVVAMLLANAVGPTGNVVAVEALAHNARVGAINAQLNGLANIHVEQAAISDRSGEIEVSIDLNAQVLNEGTTITTTMVRAVTVDELADRFGFPDVLFIDVEGFECHALRGAVRTLERRPDCFIEVHTGCGLEAAGSSVRLLIDNLRGRGYNLVAWTEEHPLMRPVMRAEDCPTSRFFLVARHGGDVNGTEQQTPSAAGRSNMKTESS
jgi:FkbM family methyltransferase